VDAQPTDVAAAATIIVAPALICRRCGGRRHADVGLAADDDWAEKLYDSVKRLDILSGMLQRCIGCTSRRTTRCLAGCRCLGRRR
jgi:hypothetical protein